MTELPGIPEIMAQRYPILLIDKILEVNGNEVRALKNITYNEPCYASMAREMRAGAFAYPCSLIIESFAQSAGVLLGRVWTRTSDSDGFVIMFGTIGNFRFLGEAFPGDILEHVARLDRQTDDMAIISGTVHCGGVLIATVERIIAVLRPVAAGRSKENTIQAATP